MRERFRKVERACARLEGLRTAPISGLPEIGRFKRRKSGKPDLRAKRVRMRARLGSAAMRLEA